jgi:hypothetical protein
MWDEARLVKNVKKARRLRCGRGLTQNTPLLKARAWPRVPRRGLGLTRTLRRREAEPNL